MGGCAKRSMLVFLPHTPTDGRSGGSENESLDEPTYCSQDENLGIVLVVAQKRG